VRFSVKNNIMYYNKWSLNLKLNSLFLLLLTPKSHRLLLEAPFLLVKLLLEVPWARPPLGGLRDFLTTAFQQGDKFNFHLGCVSFLIFPKIKRLFIFGFYITQKSTGVSPTSKVSIDKVSKSIYFSSAFSTNARNPFL